MDYRSDYEILDEIEPDHKMMISQGLLSSDNLSSSSINPQKVEKPTNIKTIMTTNIEPNFDNLITDNLCSPGFKNWVDANFNTKINSEIVRKFFLSIFALLSQYDSCFERGTFIFQNDTNVLFNILTFDKLKITTSYNCNDPLSVAATAPAGHPTSPDNVHSMATITHLAPIKLRKDLYSQAGPCVPAVGMAISPKPERKKHKFERIFDGSLSLEDVCNQCIIKTGDHHDHRRVILYYPYVLNNALNYSSDFTNNNNNTPSSSKLNFLFVKFETQPVSGTVVQKIAHGYNYLSKKASGLKSLFSSTPAATTPAATTATDTTATDTEPVADSTLDERREDDPLTIYTRTPANSFSQQSKDIRFYKQLGLSTKTLEWYNANVRIGQEFFVSQQLLEYLLMNYLFTNYTCPNEGGKRKKTQKRNKKRNKKTNKKSKKSKKSKKNFTRKSYN